MVLGTYNETIKQKNKLKCQAIKLCLIKITQPNVAKQSNTQIVKSSQMMKCCFFGIHDDGRLCLSEEKLYSVLCKGQVN